MSERDQRSRRAAVAPNRAEGAGRLDASALARAEIALAGSSRSFWRRLLPFLGPAFIAAVAYIDPGNFATNIQAGSHYGYLLVWVVVGANLMAMLIQILSAKLGVATGRNLPEVIRERFPKPVTISLWIAAELVAMATDLAEFVGAALGFNLLFGMPLIVAAFLTGAVTFAILGLQSRGFRPFEAVITMLIGVIAICYLAETILGEPDFGAAAQSFLPPSFTGSESILLAVGILGATVMPHVIYLHSALTQSRVVVADPERKRRLMHFERIDVLIAMGVAGAVNVAMLMMAAATFHTSGHTGVATIEEAHRTLRPLVGSGSSVIFGISLLASGLSSSTVGTLAGQVIMQGFINRQIPIWLRRVITMIPALVVVAIGLDPTRTLVLSQVVLSFGIPLALIPLATFTSRRDIMGSMRNGRVTMASIWGVATLIVALNIFLLLETFG